MVKWLFRVLPIMYMMAIWVMSSMSSDAIVELPDSQWDAFIKESLHLVEFGILYILLALALLTMRGLSAKTNGVLILISLYMDSPMKSTNSLSLIGPRL